MKERVENDSLDDFEQRKNNGAKKYKNSKQNYRDGDKKVHRVGNKSRWRYDPNQLYDGEDDEQDHGYSSEE